jgi:hypothetical protein
VNPYQLPTLNFQLHQLPTPNSQRPMPNAQLPTSNPNTTLSEQVNMRVGIWELEIWELGVQS